jgi:pimeloyl-ACP methyl ester carboxylesterase
MYQTNKKFVISSDGLKIYYETYTIANKPPQIFLIHGVGGDLDAWQYVKNKLLDQGISSLALDLRGHGFSTHPYLSSSYHADHLVEDILTVLTQEKINQILLIGHCYGAVIAEQFAWRFPDKLKGLILISGTYRPPLYFSADWQIKLAKFFIKLFTWFSPPPIYPGHSTYPTNKLHKDYEIIGLIRTILRNSWRSYLLTTLEIINLQFKEKLKNIKIPTLILVGDKDSIFPPTISQKMHQEISQSKLEIISEGLHNIVLNNSFEVAEKLYQFIQQYDNLPLPSDKQTAKV